MQLTIPTYLPFPNEISRYTLSFVPPLDIIRSDRVCRRARTLATDNLLWGMVYERFFKAPPPEKSRAAFIKAAEESRDIFYQTLKEAPKITDDLVCSAMEWVPFFQELNIVIRYKHQSRVTGNALRAIGQRLPDLQSFYLGDLQENSSNSCNTISDTDLSSFVTSLNPRALRKVTILASLPKVTRAGVWSIVKYCKKLKEIDITDVPLSNRFIKKLIKKQPYLTSLSLRETQKLSVRSVRSVVKCKYLKELSIDNGEENKFTPTLIVEIIKKIKNLESLHFHRMKFENDDILEICKSQPNLKNLYIRNSKWLTSQVILFIAENCENLESLSLLGFYDDSVVDEMKYRFNHYKKVYFQKIANVEFS